MKSFEFIGLVLMATLAQFATDIYLPSLPAMAEFFRVDLNKTQLSITSYMLALTLTQLFWGPISDVIGRKKTLLLGLSISILGSLVCAFTQGIEALILGRFIQGLGNGAPAGLFRAILRDLYSGRDLARIASYLSNFLVLVLMVAPLVGGTLQNAFGWQANFIFLIAWSLVCLMVLTAASFDPKDRDQIPKRASWKAAYKRLLRSPLFMGCCISNFLTYGGIFAWLTSGSSILIDEMGMSPVEFGLWSSGTGLSLMLGAYVNGRLVKTRGIEMMLHRGWTLIILSGLVLTIASLFFGPQIPVILASVFTFYLGTSLIFANVNATAFSPFGDIAGTASGLYAFIQLSGGAAMSYLIASLPESSRTLLLGLLFFLTGAGAWALFALLVETSRHSAKDL